MAKTVYICEHCHKQYNDRMDARWCEIQHETNTPELIQNSAFLQELIKDNKNPCEYCGHSYLIYGTELNCDCENKCYKGNNNYLLFVGRGKNNGIYW